MESKETDEEVLERYLKALGYLTERNEEMDAKAYALLKKMNEIAESIKKPVSELALIKQQLQGLGIEKDRLVMEKGKAVDELLAFKQALEGKESAEGLYQ